MVNGFICTETSEADGSRLKASEETFFLFEIF
jgi:hypothetical protein